MIQTLLKIFCRTKTTACVQHSVSFKNLQTYLILASLFIQNTFTYFKHTLNRDLLEIRLLCSSSAVTTMRLMPELSKTLEVTHSTQLSRSTCRQH